MTTNTQNILRFVNIMNNLSADGDDKQIDVAII